MPAVPAGVHSLIPQRKIAYYTPGAIRELKPTKRVSTRDLQGWMDSTQDYDPAKQWVGALLIGNLPNISSIGPLTTVANELRGHFMNAMRLRPLGLDVVRKAAQVFFDDLVAGGHTAPEIEAIGREEMRGYRYCFTHYDKAPLFGLQVAAAIAEGFQINWRLVKDEAPSNQRRRMPRL